MVAGGVTVGAHSEPIDALVIGSGYGGSVAALRLAEAGYHVLVLERGRRWQIRPDGNTFATYARPDGRAAWLSPLTVDPMQPQPVPIDVYTGVLEGRREDGITVLIGTGVGGGSLVNNGSTVQPPRHLFERVLPRAISYEDMERVYYPRALSVLRPEPVPADVLGTSYYLQTRVMLGIAAATGLPHALVPTLMDWAVVRQEIAGTVPPSAILGDDWYGINSGAKRSLDTPANYLGLAEATGRVEVLPLHLARSIGEAGEGRFAVGCEVIDTNGGVIGRREFVAPYVFLGAGSIGSTELLLRARARGTLPRLNDRVGTGWGANGDTVGMMVGLPPTHAAQGAPIGCMILDHDPADNAHGAVTLMNGPQYAAPEGVLFALAMGVPAADRAYQAAGLLRYDAAADRARLSWPPTNPAQAAAKRAVEETWRKVRVAATSEHHQPQMAFVDDGLTAHPLGGLTLGGACDFDGRVRGYAGLLVVDGALVAGSTASANPSLTIAALAERVLDRFIEQPDRQAANDVARPTDHVRAPVTSARGASARPPRPPPR